VNLGNPDEITILDLAGRVLTLIDSDSEIAFVSPDDARTADDPKVRCPDISRAREVLGWQPRVSLDDGLRQTVAYFQAKLGIV
jgi:nucleoside-diphosphate-sugar epimerase